MEQKEIKTEKKAVKKVKKTVKKEKKADEKPTIHVADAINFHELFRLKGHRGLWIMRSAPNRSKFISMSKFMEFGTNKIAKLSDLTSLGHLVFQTELGKADMRFSDVFRIIFDNEEEFFKLPIDKMMEMAVPCFDEDCFKDYHMQKVCEWYKEIIKGLGDEIRNQKKDIAKTVTD